MRRHPALRRLMLVLVALLLLPGWGELLETVEHLLHDGHLPHSAAHLTGEVADDHGASEEHGCTPMQHSCACHTSVPGAVDEPEPLPALIGLAQRDVPPELAGVGPTRAIPPPVRPPIG